VPAHARQSISNPCLAYCEERQSGKPLMDHDAVTFYPQDLLNSLLVYDDQDKLATARTHLHRRRQEILLQKHDERTERVPNFRMNAYAEAPPPSVQASNAQLHTPTHFITTRMHTTTETVSHTQPQSQAATLLSLEEFDKLYAVQPARISSAAPVPVPLPITPASEAVPKFNHLCQTRSITHLFTFEEISKGLFSSKVEFGGHVCEAKGPFYSKKQAKEAVAQQANDILEKMEPPSPPQKELKEDRGKPKPKRKSSYQDDSENWVALLHNFVQKHRHSQPVYRYFEANMHGQQLQGLSISPKNFSCVLNIQARPLYDFGSEEEFFQTKVEAKRVATRSAVLWLRTMGLIPESADETRTGLTQPVSEMTTEKSAAQLVVDHSLRLGLSPPQFDIKPAGDLAGKNFYLCTALYLEGDSRRVPQLKGPLCQTSPVFGQKNAKKMCCEALVVVLERVISERMDMKE
jgi:hypothetical protein